MPNVLTNWLTERYPEATPREFYRDLFPAGTLATYDEWSGHEPGTYQGILVSVERSGDGVRAGRSPVLDDLGTIDFGACRPGSVRLVSPVTYAGRRPLLSKTHDLHALVFDLDGVRGIDGLDELFYEFEAPLMRTGHTICPRPSYVVSSGTGLHLYYLLNESLRMWPNVCERLRLLRAGLTRRLWNKYVSTLYEEPQLESVVQAFRAVGSLAKDGRQRVRAFRTGPRVSIDHLNEWVPEEARVTPELYRATHTLAEARKLWPDWDPDWRARVAAPPTAESKWHVNRALYDWWCRRVESGEPYEGNRYWCLFVATAYATKCDIPYEELSEWAYGQLSHLDSFTTHEDNHFTAEDVEAALSIYRNPISCKLRRDKVAEKTGLPMPVNKRNGRKQAQHLKIARFARDLNYDDEHHWYDNGGRPTKATEIRVYAAEHPGMSNRAIASALGVSRNTVNKWLKAPVE